MATDSTMIPMPPSHWMKLRQKSSPREMDSMSVRMEDPVVVKPDTDSKNASVKHAKPSPK